MNDKQLRQEWETPPDFWVWVDGVFRFDIDVCASKDNRKVRSYFSREADSLNIPDWRGCLTNGLYNHVSESSYVSSPDIRWAWCNAGFSGVKSWIDKAIEQAELFSISTVVPMNSSTSSKWFAERKKSMSEVWQLHPRIEYIAPTSIKQTRNPKDSMMMIITPQSVRLQQEPCVRLVNWKG